MLPNAGIELTYEKFYNDLLEEEGNFDQHYAERYLALKAKAEMDAQKADS